MALITLKTTLRDANARAFHHHLSDIRPETLGIKTGDIIRYETWDNEKPITHNLSGMRFEVTCVVTMLPMVWKGYALIDMKPVIDPRFD